MSQKILPFEETLNEAEAPLHLPSIGAWYFDKVKPDIRQYVEVIWPELATRCLQHFAVDLLLKTPESPIEQKMFFALQREFMDDFFDYPSNTKLLLNNRISQISEFLREKNQAALYEPGDIDFEIDFFLYMDVSLFRLNEKVIRYPFFVGIECDGHEFHERTKEQAQKDKSKDRVLKAKGLDIVRFTGTEITRSPDACAKEIRRLMDSHNKRISDLLNAGSKT